MTNPATLAAFDQARAGVSGELDALVDALLSAHRLCGDCVAVDSMGHMVAFAQIFVREYTPDVLAALLIEAVARHALAKEAQ